MKNLVSFKRFAFVLMFIGVLSLVSCSCRGCSSEEMLDPNAHVCDWQINHTMQERSCVVDGVIEYVCSCGKEKTEVEKAVGHAFGDWTSVYESTCIEPGQEKRICSSCGEEEISYTAKREHSYSVSVETTNGVDISRYLCDICSDTFTIESLLIDGLDDISAKELYDCNADFSFEVISTEGEEYIKNHLDIYNAYFDGTEYETADGVVCSYSVVATGTDNVWKIVPTESYTAGYTYIARRSGSVVFKEYGLEPLTFSIYKPYTNEVEISSDVIFVQNLENASGGYYPFTIDFSEISQKYWVTLGNAYGLKIGDIICVGNATSFDEVVSQKNDNYFGKIDSIEKTSTGGWLISLSEPPLDELFDKLDIYSSAITSLENFETAENLEEQMVTALYEDVEFARFLSTAYVSAHEYAAERGMVAATGTFKDFVDSIKFSFIEKPDVYFQDETAYIRLKFELNGNTSVPVKVTDFAGIESAAGTVDINFKAYVYLNNFSIKLHIALGEIIFGGDIIDFAISQNITAGFYIDVATNVDYSLNATAYTYNTASDVYHLNNCKQVVMLKDKSKLEPVDAKTLLNLTDNEDYQSKDCEICKPIETLLTSSYIIDTSTKTVHTVECVNLIVVSTDNMALTERALSDLLEDGYNTNCNICNPSSIDTNAFAEKIIDKIKSGDFGEYVDDITKISSSAKNDGENRIKLGSRDFNMTLIDTEEVTFYAYFKFHLDSSLHYEYEIQHASLFGVRATNKDIEPYGGNIDNKTTKNSVTAVGKTRIDVGLGIELSISIKGLGDFIKGSADANVGVYAKVNGALQTNFVGSSEDYYAAYLESGAHCDVNIKFKIPLCNKFDENLYNADKPILNMGYSKVYYNYVAIPEEITLTQTSYDLVNDGGLLDVKYYDLINMTQGTETLNKNGNSHYSVVFSLADGSYCSIDGGVLTIDPNAPSFTDTLTVKIVGKDSWTKYGKYNYKFVLEECSIVIDYKSNNTPPDNEDNENEKLASQGLEFVSNGDGTCYVSGIGTCTDTDIVIPSTSPDGDRVTSIGYRAFWDCYSLTSVVIPNSVTSIEMDAFWYCSNLNSVVIGNGVASIGVQAFQSCVRLTSVLIPDSVTSIGRSAFNSCYGLTEITVSENNKNYKSIDGNLYTGDGKTLIQYSIGKTATEFTIPDDVTTIRYDAFFNCSSLTSVVIPKSVTSIGDSAFYGCRSLYTITNKSDLNFEFGSYNYGQIAYYAKIIIDKEGNKSYNKTDTVEYIETKDNFLFEIKNSTYTLIAYIGTNDTITLPTSIDGNKYTIYEMRGVINVIIPDGMKNIGDYAFSNCASLTSVVIGNSVTSISHHAFHDCDSLTSVVIGDSVTSIGDWAFSNCYSLTDVYYTGSEEEWNNISIGDYNENLTNATIHYNYEG